MKKIILLIILLFSSTLLAASESNYTIIIDAADDGSRLHIFQIIPTSALPIIQDIFSETKTPPLASFAGHPEQAVDVISPLLAHAKEKLLSLGVYKKGIALSIQGEDAMRSLTETDQKNIYDNLRKNILSHDEFSLAEIGNLSGKMQSIYEWLDANYLAKRFSVFSQTVGTLHIGNNSLSISYEVASQSDDTVSLPINGKTYFIFAKNFSNLGQDSIRSEVNKDRFAYACYPIGFPLTLSQKGNFDFPTCRHIYADVIKQFHLDNIPSFLQHSFIVFSNGYDIYHFLSAEITNQQAFEARLFYACTLPWGAMKQEYEGFPEKKLSTICANAVGVDQFIYEALKIPEAQIWPTDKLERDIIAWPLGKVLYDQIRF